MDARFRIRTREGDEFFPPTVEMFSQLVRSGTVHPQDLVFDALTGEWAPARSHPMVRLLQDPLARDLPLDMPGLRRVTQRAGSGTAGAKVDEPAPPARDVDEPPPPARDVDEPPPPARDVDGELELELVEPEAVSPEEEARAFIAKMDEERRNDPDVPSLSHEVPLLDPSAGTVVGLVPDPVLPAAPPMQRPRPPDSEEAREAQEPRAWTAPVGWEPERSRPSAPRYRSRGWVNAAVLGGAVVALVVSLLWAPVGPEPSHEEGAAQASEARVAPRAVPVTEEQTRSMALVAFLEGVDALREELGVGEVPPMWLEGGYLADPAAYPEVRAYWERYLAFVDAVRASEVTLYRGAYLTAAADAGLAGPVRSLRLAAAQEAFAASRNRREELYGRVEELARVALALDDLVLGMKGRVTYEPIAGPRVSADPVIEAAGTDADAQVRLEAALDRVLAVLQEPGTLSAGDRAGVPGWLARGLRGVEEGR